jgi:hypothetical protein
VKTNKSVNNIMTTWIITVEEDPKTGDCILPFPEDLLEQAGWKEGDILNWEDNGDGSWSLTKVKDE